MYVGILKTDGGPHSPEKWAAMTASQIIQVAADQTNQQAIDGRKLENKIIDILEQHHGKVQKHERQKIKDHGAERLSHALDPTDFIAPAAKEITDAAKGSRFEEHFKKPEMQDYLTNLLGQHFVTNMQIERSWHADRHPDNEHAKAFRKQFHGA